MNGNEGGKFAVVSDGPTTQTLFIAWLSVAITMLCVYVGVFLPAWTSGRGKSANDTKIKNCMYMDCTAPLTGARVIAWHPPNRDWDVWMSQRLKNYENECHRLLEDYSRLLETVKTTKSQSERLLYRRWKADLQKIARHSQEQQEALADMLQHPFSYTLALPACAVPNRTFRRFQPSVFNIDNEKGNEDALPHPIRLPPTVVPEVSYDSVSQVLIHLARDWSHQGRDIRRSLYDWCIERIPVGAHRIMVPGAGLGRLAWELQRQQPNIEMSPADPESSGEPRVVHAIELSWTMVAIFSALVGQNPGRWKIYPYLNDFWTNQASSETRFRQVQVPDVQVKISRISWTVGDFVEISQVPEEASSYDAVVTCFFLDTAANVLDYIQAMESILITGGRWINVGPLHWHANARLVLTVEDLQALFMSAKAWKILEWAIDTDPLEYRPNDYASSTRYEAYRPLRFVLEKQ